jgi:hypothetical protein
MMPKLLLPEPHHVSEVAPHNKWCRSGSSSATQPITKQTFRHTWILYYVIYRNYHNLDPMFKKKEKRIVQSMYRSTIFGTTKIQDYCTYTVFLLVRTFMNIFRIIRLLTVQKNLPIPPEFPRFENASISHLITAHSSHEFLWPRMVFWFVQCCQIPQRHSFNLKSGPCVMETYGGIAVCCCCIRVSTEVTFWNSAEYGILCGSDFNSAEVQSA